MSAAKQKMENKSQTDQELWTAENETYLLEFMMKYPPIGPNRFFHLLNLKNNLKNYIRDITAAQIYQHLREMYTVDSQVILKPADASRWKNQMNLQT